MTLDPIFMKKVKMTDPLPDSKFEVIFDEDFEGDELLNFHKRKMSFDPTLK